MREKEQPHGKGWGRWRSASEMERDGDRRTGWERKGLVRETAVFGLREKEMAFGRGKCWMREMVGGAAAWVKEIGF